MQTSILERWREASRGAGALISAQVTAEAQARKLAQEEADGPEPASP